MRFSSEFIEKVRSANNIVDLLSEYTTFKRSGSRLMGRCPFPGHNEKTPSFSVSEDKQVYHCFGCQRSGQIFTALEELKGMSFPEAVEYLADRAGISMPQESTTTKENIEVKKKKDRLNQINQIATNYYHQEFIELSADHPVRQYAAKRGLTAEIIDIFKIGYATEAWEGLVQRLQFENHSVEEAAELGLVRARKDGSGYFDLFRQRLMFPIITQKSEVVGFGGRTLAKDQNPKYLNSPESDLFHKGQTFYGLNESAKYIRSSGYGIIVEGYMDYLMLYANGIKNVVATLGTALTTQHAKILRRTTDKVVVLYDGDQAGQNAAIRSLPILLSEGLMPKGVMLPDELDPDDFLKKFGAMALKEKIAQSSDLFSVVLQKNLLNFRGSASDKVQLMDAMSPILDPIVDARLKDLYIAEIALKIGVEPAWIRKSLLGGVNRAKEAEKRASVTPQMPKDVIPEGGKIEIKGSPRSELFLLNIALINKELFEMIWASEVIADMRHPGVQELFLLAERYYRQMPNEFDKLSAYLMTRVQTPQDISLFMAEPMCSLTSEGLQKMTLDCVRQVKEKNLRNKSRELANELRSEPADVQLKKLEQIMNIQKSKLTLRRDQES